MIQELENHQLSKHQISIRSCAPAPLWGIQHILKELHPSTKLNLSISNDNEKLITGLYNHEYSIIILDYPINNDNYISIHLFDVTLHFYANYHKDQLIFI